MHFIMLIDAVDQEFRQGNLRMAHRCSVSSDASAGKTGRDWVAGDCCHVEAALLIYVRWLMLAVGWDLSWNCQPQHLPGPSM